MQRGHRYYRQVTATVLRWYFELEDGVIPGAVFDTRVLDYRIDVGRVLHQLKQSDREALFGVHRDGLSHGDALRSAGDEQERPDAYIAALESQLGQRFERSNLSNIQGYLTPLHRQKAD